MNISDLKLGARFRYPTPAVELTMVFRHDNERDRGAALFGGEASVVLGDVRLAPMPLFVGGSIQGGIVQGKVIMPLPPSVCSAVQRNGDGSVSLGLRLSVVVGALHEVRPGLFSPAAPMVHVENLPLQIVRDEWLSLLEDLGFDEVAVFELPAKALRATPELAEALTHLHVATRHHRNGMAREALGCCRNAFELLLKAMGKNNDLKKGAEALWDRVAGTDGRLREALDEIVNAMSKLQHLGRHAGGPGSYVGPEESLLALRHTIALFEYVGQKLSERPT